MDAYRPAGERDPRGCARPWSNAARFSAGARLRHALAAGGLRGLPCQVLSARAILARMPENAKLGMRYEWRTQQPGGASVIGDFWLAPGRTGSPDHINPLFTEHVTVRSGVAEFRCGDKRWNEDAGAHVELPAGVPHNFRNVGDTELHVEVEIRPPGEYPAFL